MLLHDNPPLNTLVLGVTQVGLQLAHLAKLLLGIFRRHRRRHNHILTNVPVDGSGHALPVCRLERVNDAQDLRRVAARRGRVQHGETDLLLGVDDEDGADGERDALLGDVVQVTLVDHVVKEGNLAVGIRNDGELDVGVGDFVDVIDPLVVGAEVVGTLHPSAVSGGLKLQRKATHKTNHLDASLFKLILQLGEGTQLGGADGREVSGVGEENGPAVADELVEVDLAMGGKGLEVGSYAG